MLWPRTHERPKHKMFTKEAKIIKKMESACTEMDGPRIVTCTYLGTYIPVLHLHSIYIKIHAHERGMMWEGCRWLPLDSTCMHVCIGVDHSHACMAAAHVCPSLKSGFYIYRVRGSARNSIFLKKSREPKTTDYIYLTKL